jgi:hypothetical protein
MGMMAMYGIGMGELVVLAITAAIIITVITQARRKK